MSGTVCRGQALIYGAMNVLSYVSIRRIDAAVFTVCAQLKILTRAARERAVRGEFCPKARFEKKSKRKESLKKKTLKQQHGGLLSRAPAQAADGCEVARADAARARLRARHRAPDQDARDRRGLRIRHARLRRRREHAAFLFSE